MPQIQKTTYGRYALKLNDLVLGVWSDLQSALDRQLTYIRNNNGNTRV